MSSYTDKEKAQFKKEWGRILAKKVLDKKYKKKWHSKKIRRKRGLKKGEWKGAK